MMSSGNFRNARQVLGKRQRLKHHDSLNDMIINFESFLFSQCPARNAQIIDLAQVEFMLGDLHLEVVKIFWVRRIRDRVMVD